MDNAAIGITQMANNIARSQDRLADREANALKGRATTDAIKAVGQLPRLLVTLR